jgi:2-keto-4-pentenoate hydratase/2-oxohepta-3-ene-1,7-dioic acid hydratase in catechol pathway
VYPADASALELLIVIGKTARSVSEAEALDYVAGYAIGRDFSARDLQLEKTDNGWSARPWMVSRQSGLTSSQLI